MSFRGWACVHPGWPDYGVPSTQVAVYHGTTRLPVLEIRQTVYRPDVFAAGACSGYYSGFVVWVYQPVSSPSNYYVAFEGPYGLTYLEGQSYY